jgi:hypothetical protein
MGVRHQPKRLFGFVRNRCTTSSEIAVRHTPKWLFVFARDTHFKSPEQAQRFLEPFSSVCNHFRPRRHRLAATAYRQLMDEQRATWREVTAVPAAR